MMGDKVSKVVVRDLEILDILTNRRWQIWNQYKYAIGGGGVAEAKKDNDSLFLFSV